MERLFNNVTLGFFEWAVNKNWLAGKYWAILCFWRPQARVRMAGSGRTRRFDLA
jgi:hypothetical protein